MATDYTRDEIDVVIDLIRSDNENKALSGVLVSFGNPNAFSPTEQINRNTLLIATAKPGYLYRGSQTFYYNRVPLDKFYEQDVHDITFDEEGKRFISDILPELNERLGINLTADKILDSRIPAIPENFAGVDVLVQVLPTSLVYLDSLLVRIGRSDNDLFKVIVDPEMDGLEYSPPVD